MYFAIYGQQSLRRNACGFLALAVFHREKSGFYSLNIHSSSLMNVSADRESGMEKFGGFLFLACLQELACRGCMHFPHHYLPASSDVGLTSSSTLPPAPCLLPVCGAAPSVAARRIAR